MTRWLRVYVSPLKVGCARSGWFRLGHTLVKHVVNDRRNVSFRRPVLVFFAD